MGTCATTCPYCGVGCGVAVDAHTQPVGAPDAARETLIVSSLSGDTDHPANAGRLCVKGTALAETLSTEGRLLYPEHDGERVAWDTALDLLASKLRTTREQHGPGSVAFYLSGQLLTEDYYAANKLMKGFLGSSNVDTNSRLCMSSAVAAYQRAFGEDVVPCTYEDLETCDLLVMVGSNAAWTHPVIYQRIAAAKQANPNKRIVVIDTRRTATAELADLFLQIKPGTDSALFGGLLRHVAQTDALDTDYIEAHTHGFDAALEASALLDEEHVAAVTGLSLATLREFYACYATTPAAVTLYSQGINQSATGTDNCNAIINCHLATGRIGKAGAGPFSITGQPNAMGGREVGGLATQLAAHRRFTPQDIDAVGRFWGATDMATEPGLKAVDMFQAAARGQIKFLWIMATNPVVSLPASAQVADALEACDFVVVSDCTGNSDTAQYADLLLPAASWGEKSGTVTNSERVISRQRQFAPIPGEAQPDWWIITETAKRMGLGGAFNYDSPADIFREHAALSGFENNGRRCFDISALKDVSDAEYDDLAPQRWPLAQARVLADGHFPTDDGRAQFVAVAPAAPQSDDRLVVNTGRLRDQWHTMTRTGSVPRLAAHRDFFSLSVHPADAAARGLVDGSLGRLANDQGEVVGSIAFDADLPQGQVWLPIHWSEQFANRALVNNLIAPVTDPVSGQPQSKFALAELTREPVDSWALLFTREVPVLSGFTYWSRTAAEGGHVTLVADSAGSAAMHERLQSALGLGEEETIAYTDEGSGETRQLVLQDGKLEALLVVCPERSALPERSWMSTLGAGTLPTAPHHLLAGCDPKTADVGATVCSCWEIGEKQIAQAITTGANSVELLGERLRCGTQCGSCLPELKRLIQAGCEAQENAA